MHAIAKTEVQKNEETEEEVEVEVVYPLYPKPDASPSAGEDAASAEGTNKIAADPTILRSQNGVCLIKDLVYAKSESFDEGCYVLTITDTTQSQTPLAELKVALVICSN
jgi:hypothetical protein